MTAISRILAGGCAALALAALAACGGGASSVKPVALLNTGGGGAADEAALTDSADGFALTVSPDSFLGAQPAGGFSVDVSRAGEELVATVRVTSAQSLRALYCELAYDSATYTPLSVEHLPLSAHDNADAPDEDMLTISVLDRPGTAHIGQVLAHWQDRAGLSGDAELARVRFASRPFAADATRAVSSALTSSAVGPKLELSLTHRRLRWDYYYPGDYNQDGLVGVSDLTPLGAHLDERGDSLGKWYDEELEQYVPLGYAFDPDSLLWVIDGSGDGFITVSDITQIGQHFDEGVESFRLFESAVPSRDMPQANGDPSTILPLATVPFSTAQGMAGQERIWFNLPLLSARDGFSYWLRPLKEEAEGTASNPVRFDAGIAESFWLDIQPDTYITGGSLEEARLDVKDGPAGLVADIWLEGAENLSYFTAELHYDYQQCAFERVYTSGEPCATLPLSVEKSSSTCTHQASGQLLIFDFLMEGFTGSGYDARAFFSRAAEDEFTRAGLAGAHGCGPISLQFDLQRQQLSWYYTNRGDYNQDGGVWSDEFVQLGRFWESESPGFPGPFPSASIEWIVDGNSDGFIGFSDVNSIGLNFAQSLDGYNVYMGPVPAAEPGPEPLGYVSLAEAEGDPFNERLRFSFHVHAPAPAQFLWVRPEFRGEVGEIPEGGVVPVVAE